MARSIITVQNSGSFKNTKNIIERINTKALKSRLEYFGKKGVELLAAATPKDTGTTAASWGYEIVEENGVISLYWTNSSMIGNTPIVILIRYGHATRNGGYVVPNDFITPIVEKEFKEMADTIWKEVTRT